MRRYLLGIFLGELLGLPPLIAPLVIISIAADQMYVLAMSIPLFIPLMMLGVFIGLR